MVRELNVKNQKTKLFLGVDGGQSHTEALIADENGSILGRGFGGASNHAEVPGGRERLEKAILNSVGAALKSANLSRIDEIIFAAAHFGMTGGADYKQKIIGEIVKADDFVIGHDAPTALFGATAGTPGIVVIAGTGSIVYGENERGETAQIGGLGFLFSDEGSGFWLAAQTIRLAVKERDGLIEKNNLEKIVVEFFGKKTIREVTSDFYNAKISRDEIASLAKTAARAASEGNAVLREQINFGAKILAESVGGAARRLKFEGDFPVAGVGGMFRGDAMRQDFQSHLSQIMPRARFAEPRFSPTIGALLLAYKQSEIIINERLLANLEKTQTAKTHQNNE